MLSGDADDIKKWKEDAMNTQQHYYDSLGDREYDYFSSYETNLLEVKIAYAYFGAPTVDENQNISIEDRLSIDNYDDNQKKFTQDVKDKIVEVTGSNTINVAFLFVIVKKHGNNNAYLLPVIRLKKRGGTVCFLDNFLRVHTDWNDYIKKNELPKRICCYPKNGFYQSDKDGNVLCEVTTSPRCNIDERVVNGAKVDLYLFRSDIVPIGANTGASAGVNTVVGSSYKTNDRASQDQSINLTSHEMRVNPTKKEVLNFRICVFFFFHLSMSFESAKKFIPYVQIDNHGRTLSEETSKTFKVFSDKSELLVLSNARFIKSINNPDEFWQCLANAGETHSVEFHKSELGQIVINKEMVIHANKLVEMNLENPTAVDEIFLYTNRLMNDANYASTTFLEDVSEIVKTERVNFEISRRQTLDKLRQNLGVQDLQNYKVAGKAIFHDMDPHQIDRIGVVMEQCKVWGDSQLLKAIKIFAEKTGCTNASDFVACLEIVDKFKAAEGRRLKDMRRKSRSAYIVQQLNDPNSNLMNKFCSDYDQVFSKVSPLNATADQPFKSDKLAAYHFIKHRNFQGRELTPKGYFDKVKKLFNAKHHSADFKPKLSQDGHELIFNCHTDDGKFGVFVKPVVTTDSYKFVTATVYYMRSLNTS